MEIDVLLQGACIHHTMRAAASHEAGGAWRFAGACGDEDAFCFHLAKARRGLNAQLTVFTKFKHSRCGSDIEALRGFAKFCGKARAGPQASVTLPTETEMSAVARDAACFCFALKDHNITYAEIS
jgi:hypothetical protein